MEMQIYLGKNRGWFLAYGIVLALLGALSICAATFVTVVSVVFLGTILLLGGIVALIATFKSWRHKAGEFILNLVMSLLYLAAGILLIRHPMFGAISITLMLAVFYIVLGLFRILSAVSLRLPRWGWGLFSGIVALLLGILILSHWPTASLFIIGLFIGIELLISGWTYILLSMAAKR